MAKSADIRPGITLACTECKERNYITTKNRRNTPDRLELKKFCPRCGKPYYEPPALSRLDNETLICPDCGTREALDSIGVSPEEQDSIIQPIHRCLRSE